MSRSGRPTSSGQEEYQCAIAAGAQGDIPYVLYEDHLMHWQVRLVVSEHDSLMRLIGVGCARVPNAVADVITAAGHNFNVVPS